MDGGQSISFNSFDSSNYPPHNNLTFHQTQHFNSQYDLAKDSMIKNFPGKKVNLGQNLQVLVLLQTAEIERLTINLHQYRMKFKRILNNQKDYNSFKYQADELLQAKDALQLRNKKIYQYAQNQKGELIDQIKYVQTLQNKYRRALKLIQEAHLSKQEVQLANSQLKEEIIAMERTFQAFKQKSIEEYQVLRDQLEKAKNEELSFEINKFKSQKQRWGEIINRQQSKYASQKQKYETILQQQRSQCIILSGQVQRLKKQLVQKKQYIQEIIKSYKKNEEQKENHFGLLGTELQRLNNLLKDKSLQFRQIESQLQEASIKLNKKNQEMQWFKRESERHRNKNALYESEMNRQNEQITALSANVSSLANKLHQMGLIIEQKNVEITLKDKKLTQQMENYNQNLSKSEHYSKKEIQEFKLANNNLVKEFQKAKRQLIAKQQSWNKRQSQWQVRVRELQQQKNETSSNLNKQVSRMKQLQQRYRLQTTKLVKDIEILRTKIEESYLQKRNLEQTYRRQQKQFMHNYNRIHQQKWDQLNQRYIKSNQQVKSLFQNKQNLEKTVNNLKNLLQKSQYEKQQLRKCHTFESMINEIQTLCQSTLEKDSEIQKLKTIVSSLQEEIRQVKHELQLLRQATVNLINQNNTNESSRRQDNYLLIEQIKKLFMQHSMAVEEIKENTHKIAYNYNKHKQFMESTQEHLIKSKEFQINDLREKLAYSQRETHSKNQLKDIINKIIVITKENSELKVTNSKKSLQNQHLAKELYELKERMNRTNESIEINMRDKDQMCKKLLIQLQQSNSLLFEEKQNEMKLQSTLVILEEEKDKEIKELQTKERIIQQLKNSIKAKDQQSQKLNSAIQQIKRSNERLKEQKRQLSQKTHHFELIINEKDMHIKQLKERYQHIQRNNKEKQLQYEQQIKQLSSIIKQTSQQSILHISKLKDQINILISQNNDLKEQMIKTGSTILNLSQQNQHLKDYQIRYNSQFEQCASYKQQITQLIQNLQQQQMIKYQYENMKMQYDYCKRQSEQNKKMIFSYSQKYLSCYQRIQILQKQIKKMENIIHDFQIKNSQLQSSHYQQSLTIQKNKVTQQKILILNEEIDRLQIQRMNLIQELNICRLQMSQQSTLDRQIKENHVLLVLMFAEIQSLRQTLHKKEQQIDQLRRNSLR